MWANQRLRSRERKLRIGPDPLRTCLPPPSGTPTWSSPFPRQPLHAPPLHGLLPKALATSPGHVQPPSFKKGKSRERRSVGAGPGHSPPPPSPPGEWDGICWPSPLRPPHLRTSTQPAEPRPNTPLVTKPDRVGSSVKFTINLLLWTFIPFLVQKLVLKTEEYQEKREELQPSRTPWGPSWETGRPRIFCSSSSLKYLDNSIWCTVPELLCRYESEKWKC